MEGMTPPGDTTLSNEAADKQAKIEQWRRENRHLIDAWNEWDAAHPLLTESDLR